MTELADNSTNVSLNGNQPFITGNVPGQCVRAYDGPPVSGTTTSGLVSGVNTLTFNVDNCYPAADQNPTGLDFVATITYSAGGGGGGVPEIAAAPAIAAHASVGDVLTCSPGTWTGATGFMYKWLRNRSAVVSPPSPTATYRVTAADYQQLLSCEVIASAPGGTASAVSEPVPVGGPPCFSLTGRTLRRCQAKAAYADVLSRCLGIDTSTTAGAARHAACVDTARRRYGRALALIGCDALTSKALQAACRVLVAIVFSHRSRPTAPIRLSVRPLVASVNMPFDLRIGTLWYPTHHPRDLSERSIDVTIGWGDGTSSKGTLQAGGSTLDRILGRIEFSVRGTHRYRSPGTFQVTLDASAHGVDARPATGAAVVVPATPSSDFVVQPDPPHQGTGYTNDLIGDGAPIAVLVPARPTATQKRIVSYQWDFGDGWSVVDSPQTDGTIENLLGELAADPGNPTLRALAAQLGILPPNQGPTLGLLGGLSADAVRSVVNVWRVEFPHHNVPHIFPNPGRVGVRLTVSGQGRTYTQADVGAPFAQAYGTSVHNLPVTPNCLRWLGFLPARLNPFGDLTDCDTRAGWNAVGDFGHYRWPPDYVSEGIKATGSLRGLSVAGGPTIAVSLRGLLKDGVRRWDRDVLIGVAVEGGLGAGDGVGALASLAGGWIGPPNDQAHPPSPDDVNAFVSGRDAYVGGSAQIGAGIIALGGQAMLVYSPRGVGGVEAALTGGTYAGISASAGVGFTCSSDLAHAGLPSSAVRPLRALADHVRRRAYAKAEADLRDVGAGVATLSATELGSVIKSLIDQCT